MVDVRQTETKRFQIRDGSFGLALYEADSAQEALLDFFADRRRAEIRRSVIATGDAASVTVDGVTYTAKRFGAAT